MFYKYSILTVILLINLSVYSKDIELGIQAGPTVTKSFGKSVIKYSADIRYAAEVYVKYSFSSTVGIRTGLGFEDKGGAIKNITFTDGAGNPIGTGKLHHHLQYITIPILAEFTFGKKVQPYFNTGLYMGILAKGQDIAKYDKAYKTDITQYFNRFDMGFVLGVGIKVPIKEKFLFNIDIRNSIGFLRTNKNSNPYMKNVLNYSTAFNIGFAYKFGKKESTTK